MVENNTIPIVTSSVPLASRYQLEKRLPAVSTLCQLMEPYLVCLKKTSPASWQFLFSVLIVMCYF